MPTIAVVGPYRLFFYSNEGSPREAVHVHVRGAGGEAKVWLEPTVRVDRVVGLTASDLRDIELIVRGHVSLIRERWNAYFGS